MLKPGKLVPDLKAQTTSGEIRLRDLRGQFVVVYFYPRDNTSGCTREAQDFRDLATKFKKHNAVILGVSRDSLKSHENFRAKHALPFDLIADIDEVWCKGFDVIHEKKLYGKAYVGIVRSTFLIGPEGKLRHE
ncbi:MAG TPA: peroxiredoxin, partial [Rudaea sp.]|nr:peroxiredoxin [Rudaea sp.]